MPYVNNYRLLCILFIFAYSLVSCSEDDMMEMEEEAPPVETAFALGWTGDDDMSTIPTSTNFGFGNGTLPSSADLVPMFPPIGDQGQYGTCVSWAVAYNIKTALSGAKNGLSAAQLASPAHQFSPKDLFLAIPDEQKGPNCGGTNFSFALDVMQSRGVATMQTVPYTGLGDCSQSQVQSGWTQEAGQNKIQYWRKIDASIQSIKQNIANNIPVILGAKLADNFMSWNSDNVITSSTSFNNVGQHAYHAMVIAGYDDTKGPNGAFRVINSWGEFWGDLGYVWIDYNYLINEFCSSFNGERSLFIAADGEDSTNPPDDTNVNTVGVDLAPWVFADYSTYEISGIDTERQIELNVYNIGTDAAASAADWSIYYIYFNAYDAEDYGVLFYDEFNNSVAPNSFECLSSDNCVFNYNIPSGSSFTEAVWNQEGQTRTYYMPDITGYYYLVLIADVGDAFAEGNELNNLFYTTSEPKYFDRGYSFRQSKDAGHYASSTPFSFENDLNVSNADLRHHRFSSAISAHFKNAYTPKEVMSYFKNQSNKTLLQTKLAATTTSDSAPYQN